MPSYINALTFILLFLTALTASTPLERRALSPREPVSAAALGDWPTNVVMVGGAETYGMWIPADGEWHSLSDIQCLDMPAYNILTCSAVTIDKVGVASGYGPCTLIGSSGWAATLSGDSGEGYTYVGPPQTLVLAQCAPAS